MLPPLTARQANRIGGEFAQAIEATDETRWAILAALQEFPSEPSEVWLSKEDRAVHWLSIGALVTVTVPADATPCIRARAVAGGDAWSLEVIYQSGQIGRVVVHPGLKSSWSFSLPSAEKFEVSGEIAFTGGEAVEIDAGEIFGRSLASRMMASPETD
jgi:hypothetical protein